MLYSCNGDAENAGGKMQYVKMTEQLARHENAGHEIAIVTKLQNVAIAMHCNLRPPDAAPVLIHFYYEVHAKFEVAQPMPCRLIAFSLLLRYVTL